MALREMRLADWEAVSRGGPMDPLVERDMDETLVTELLVLMEARVALLVSPDERMSESDRAGKVREELDADEVSVEGRDEESLALR